MTNLTPTVIRDLSIVIRPLPERYRQCYPHSMGDDILYTWVEWPKNAGRPVERCAYTREPYPSPEGVERAKFLKLNNYLEHGV